MEREIDPDEMGIREFLRRVISNNSALDRDRLDACRLLMDIIIHSRGRAEFVRRVAAIKTQADG